MYILHFFTECISDAIYIERKRTCERERVRETKLMSIQIDKWLFKSLDVSKVNFIVSRCIKEPVALNVEIGFTD